MSLIFPDLSPIVKKEPEAGNEGGLKIEEKSPHNHQRHQLNLCWIVLPLAKMHR